MATPLRHIFHLYSRAGFGISCAEAKVLSDKSIREIVDDLFTSSAAANDLVLFKKDFLQDIRDEVKKGAADKKDVTNILKKKTVELNAAWLNQLFTTNNFMREKQTLFWHNHFACIEKNPFFSQELNNVIRRLAFSNFPILLLEVAKSPAMIGFLNNRQNRVEHPNENFARELMELFTLGRGNYSETDVKESARAFTGWSFSFTTAAYDFNEKHHDFGEKSFMGQKGNFGGEDIIKIIVSSKQTAYYLCKKLYKYYVNEKVDDSRINSLAEFYFSNQYNTEILLKKIFTSDWFYDEPNIGCNIKSPIDLIVGLSRQFNIKYGNEEIFMALQKQMGQILFFPPNVAGWPGGKRWIDSNSLLLRMTLPSLILGNGSIESTASAYDPESASMTEDEENNSLFDTKVDWSAILDRYVGMDLTNISQALLEKQPSMKKLDAIAAESNDVKEQIIKLLSLPEYNLC